MSTLTKELKMGFDIYGIEPKLKSQEPRAIDWDTATDKEKDAFCKATTKFEKENKGVYFRNTAWWWRPLAYLISSECKFLTEEQERALHYNDGHTYGKETALKIARTLEKLFSNGKIDSIEEEHNQMQKEAEKNNKEVQKELDKLKAEVSEIRPTENLAPRDYPFPYNKHWEEIYQKRDRAEGYPFCKQNIKNFVVFLKECGGFRVC